MTSDRIDPPVTLRRATREDVPAIVALHAADALGGHGDSADPDDLPVYLAAFDRMAASGTDRLFVACLGDAVVGTYQISFSQSLTHHGRLRAIVEAVQVSAAVRSRGIGAAMMRHAEDEARTAGAGVVELTSNRRRTAAHRFYERLGFIQSHLGFKKAID